MRIYTDGAYSMKKGRGAWAFVMQEDDKWLVVADKLLDSSSQRAELHAVIYALQHAHRSGAKKVEIVTDSQYVLCGHAGMWKLKTNLDLWDVLHSAVKDVDTVTVQWLPRCSEEGMIRADEAAKRLV